MASSDQDDVNTGENGNVARRTRSGRAVKSPIASTTRPSRGKKPTKKPVFDECDEELNEMPTGMSDYFEPDDTGEFELPLGCDKSADSPSANITQPFGEESNGSMDGMLKTCFRENLNNDPDEMMDQSIPFEPMDVSIVDSTSFSESVPLEFDKNDDDSEYYDIQNNLPASKSTTHSTRSRAQESADDSDDAVEPPLTKCRAKAGNKMKEAEEDPDMASEESSDIKEESSPIVKSPSVKSVRKASEFAEDRGIEVALKKSTVEMTDNLEERGRESGETEVVSEDELPGVEKPEVKDAENVSDDELPGPKPADLPADTEVVSEDELPSAKKESRKRKTGNAADSGYDPGSPTSEDEGASKKQAISKDGEAKPTTADKRLSEDKTSKKKVLPELDKYWKAVNDDAADFTGWTYLLQYVDQENEVEAAREAYDAFLSHYPYCYGYWRKYADYEKRKGIKKKCLEVLERGLRGIPLSVDLWIHFLNHIKATRTEDIDYIRQQYERAVGACGLEFRSDRLWESYIKWETENGVLLNVTALYDRLLATPTLGYITHFDNFQEHIMMNSAHAVIPIEMFVQLRSEVRAESKTEPVPDSDPDIPPGEEEADDHTRSEEEVNAIKEKIITIRRKVHKVTIDQVAQRWNFEEGIKRPYFHVKPLERCQLKNWKAYLEWEEEKGDPVRTLVLYERCLIACALYEEFWLRLVQYLETRAASLPDDAEDEKSKLITKARDVLERACTIHHLDKPSLHLRFAFFEENQGNAARASDILERLDKTCPNLLQVAYRRINLERRRKDYDKCCQLYESYISSSKSKAIASNLAIKYARFLMRFKNDIPAATRTLRTALVRDPTCHRLYLQMVDVAMFSPDFDVKQAIGYLDEFLAIEGLEYEFRMQFTQLKLELQEEMGSSVDDIQSALQAYQTLAKQQHKKKNKDKVSGSDGSNPNKKKGDSTAPPLPPTSASQSNAGLNSSGGVYGSGYSTGTGGGTYNYSAPPPSQPAPQPHYDNSTYPPQPYQQTPWTQYQQPPNPYQHNPWTTYQNYY